MSQNLPVIRISKWDMRRLFNEGRFYQRLLSGELTIGDQNEYIPQIVSRRIPVNSQSFEFLYYDRQGALVAIVQQFIVPTGQIGASGKPDPKRLIINGTVYRIGKQGKREPPPLTNSGINQILQKRGIDAALTFPRSWLLQIKRFYHLRIRNIFVRLGLAEDR